MFPSERFRNIRCPYGEELCPRKYHCFFSHRPDTSANARLPHIKVVNEAFPNEDGSPKTVKKRPRQAVLDPVASKRPAVDPDSNKPTITAATSHVPTTGIKISCMQFMLLYVKSVYITTGLRTQSNDQE
ncbi:hypothetical protein BATDEDRAFT_87675 [Batrachochytrium dendrobatidis JAM81]|uniref:C3H1-type domain-containing protein n=2 Tax=Batrachochytrium dendrobatidis TaxID=109871 RepID=F4P0H6_BATDJ|nr:uncharacterized protein BATDEDRAFT_87675 [Batrachochytrium dendrobatidis JAM81]EGF81591.1 hypothetical protein BATDEDRAFT_87675 [Batrachochytrium dendrobatidis JAM81]OAJ38140.1 hypothetical protein BDEG_22093 [Batrachochytrium dendrobatidis JEL423]|eukprot:XP_006678254.1 hypothetical protein BATDEDRAFT_87675 [Batrachochytrium dendrobatidis JAM81]